MRFTIPHTGARRGFTLIEVLIIALIISILSSIAVINIQSFVDNNKRKAVIAETRQLATAIGFAHDDIGFFPKFCFLTEARVSPRLSRVNATGQVIAFHPDFQVYGASYAAGDPAVSLWKGPYMGVSDSRAGAAQGVGGITLMELNDNGGALPPEGQVMVWPADVWGEPYMLYAFKWRFNASLGRYEKVFISSDRITDFRESPSASVHVVSYGKNRVPGLGLFPGNIAEGARKDLRLYTTPNIVGGNPQPDYRIRTHSDLMGTTAVQMNRWRVFDGNPDGQGPGITERGSDDVVAEF